MIASGDTERGLVDERGARDRTGQLRAQAPGQQIVVCGDVALGRPDIGPVAGLPKRAQPRTDEGREGLALDRDGPAVGDPVEHGRLEDVGARVDQIRVDLAGIGLLEKAEDAAVGVGAHESVAARIGHGRERDARGCAASAVRRDEIRERSVRQDIAVEREERVGHASACGMPDSSRRAQRPGLDDVLELESERALPEARLDGIGQVAAAEDHAGHARLGEALEHVRQQRSAEQGEHRLGPLERERAQPRALSSDEHDSVHGLTLPMPVSTAHARRPRRRSPQRAERLDRADCGRRSRAASA